MSSALGELRFLSTSFFLPHTPQPVDMRLTQGKLHNQFFIVHCNTTICLRNTTVRQTGPLVRAAVVSHSQSGQPTKPGQLQQ